LKSIQTTNKPNQFSTPALYNSNAVTSFVLNVFLPWIS
jgi:hypothetical protein